MIDETEDFEPPYTITFECGCVVEHKDALKMRPYRSYPEGTKRLYCPNHPNVFKKTNIILTCLRCGEVVTKSKNGYPLQYRANAKYCPDCYIQVRYELARNRKIFGVDKDKQYGKKKNQSLMDIRKSDCINYDQCLKQAAIKNDLTLACEYCNQYEKTFLDILNYQQIDSYDCESIYNKIPVNFKKELDSVISKNKFKNQRGSFNYAR